MITLNADNSKISVRPFQTGDVVRVIGGRFSGAFCTYVGKVDGWFVLLNSFGVGGFIRVRTIALQRQYDPTWRKSADEMTLRDYDARIEFVKRVTGVA